MNLKDIYGMFFGSFDRDNVDPVILSERGFALVNGKEIVFDKEYHYQNLQDVVREVYLQEFLDICKKCDNDSMEYIKYLMKKDVIIFLNYSLAHLDEYKVDPSLIYDGIGFLFMQKEITELNLNEQEHLFKYMNDFKRMKSVDVKVTSFNNKGKFVKKNYDFVDLEKYLALNGFKLENDVKSL